MMDKEERHLDHMEFSVQEHAIQVDNLKNTLIGVNEKLEVHNDLYRDVDTHKALLKDSEKFRGSLQQQIADLKDTLDKDT